MDFLLDIPMCAYNHENYIAQAIEGVVIQKTNFKFRLLIGEDCSKDKTRSIIKEYALKYPDKIFPIFHETNIGAAENSKLLFSLCTSKYTALCDGDDYWTDPLKLQKQVDFLEQNKDFSACFHNTIVLKEGGETEIYKEFEKDYYTIEDTLDTIALLHTSSVVFRRAALIYPDWIKEIRSGDMVIFSIIARMGFLKYLPYTMSVYRKHGTGISVVKENEGIEMNQNHLLRLNYTDKFLEYKYSSVIAKAKKKYERELFYYTKLGKLVSAIRIRTRLRNLFLSFQKRNSNSSKS